MSPRTRAALAASALLAMPNARTAAQAPDSIPAWRVDAGVDLGAPSGWVQVRENAIAGTRLAFGPDLHARRLAVISLGVARRLGARTRFDATVTATSLDGTVTLPRDVAFNGATLEHGTALRTETGFPRFVTVAVALDRRVLSFGGGSVSVRGGLSFTGLTFVLRGTLAPQSALHETSEDFVTQELPVPLAGVSAAIPIARRIRLVADVEGSYLPRVNSLRREGGEVTLRQSGASLTAGVQYDVGRVILVAAGYRAGVFAQHESSTEDGNDIVLRASAIAVRLAIVR